MDNNECIPAKHANGTWPDLEWHGDKPCSPVFKVSTLSLDPRPLANCKLPDLTWMGSVIGTTICAGVIRVTPRPGVAGMAT